jgi:hypothetical protein
MLSLLLAATLAYLTPQGWQKQTTTSPMRVAEFALPRADGDTKMHSWCCITLADRAAASMRTCSGGSRKCSSQMDGRQVLLRKKQRGLSTV